jgi:hypothetical protein
MSLPRDVLETLDDLELAVYQIVDRAEVTLKIPSTIRSAATVNAIASSAAKAARVELLSRIREAMLDD